MQIDRWSQTKMGKTRWECKSRTGRAKVEFFWERKVQPHHMGAVEPHPRLVQPRSSGLRRSGWLNEPSKVHRQGVFTADNLNDYWRPSSSSGDRRPVINLGNIEDTSLPAPSTTSPLMSTSRILRTLQ